MNNDQQKNIDDIILAGKLGVTSYSSGLVRRGLELANQILPDDHKNLELDDSRVATTTQSETVQSLQTDDLSSEHNVDYTRLRDLLAAQKWQQADNETYLVMLKVVGRNRDEWIRDEELSNFPCTDLRTIDRLWVKYSNGRFGFSVQKKIYLEVGGVPDGKYYEQAWEKFGDRVGWRVNRTWIYYNKVTFNTIAPEGHLPSFDCIGLNVLFLIWGSLLSHPDL